jgi:hypothetical protein
VTTTGTVRAITSIGSDPEAGSGAFARYVRRVRTSVRDLVRTFSSSTPAPDPARIDIAEAAVRAIRRELPHELVGVVASDDPSFGVILAKRLHVPVRAQGELEQCARGERQEVQGATAVEVRDLVRVANKAQVRLRIHTATGHRRTGIITSELEVIVARRSKKRWRLVSRRVRMIV